MNLVARAKNILLTPQTEWGLIERESGDTGYLLKNYVAILAAIPAVCGFIGSTMIGMNIFLALLHAIVGYLLTFVGVFVMAFVIDMLAGLFEGRKNFSNAMKMSAYFPTAAWLAGMFNLIPALALLSILGLYSFYLLYTGLSPLMKTPAEKSLVYTIAVAVCAIIVWIVMLAIPAALIGARLF